MLIFHDYYQNLIDDVTTTTATRGGLIVKVVMSVEVPLSCGGGYASDNSPE